MSFDITKISPKVSALLASANSETQFVYSEMPKPNVSSVLLSMIDPSFFHPNLFYLWLNAPSSQDNID